MLRPLPPAHLHGPEGAFTAPTFVSAPDLLEWLTSTFIDEAGALHNPDHIHLLTAQMAVLWTNVPNTRHGRRIIGQCEFKPPSGTMGKWARGRAEAQLLEWFHMKPDFLLTFDAEYAGKATDAEFCAIAEHELYHAGQQLDEFGQPKFSEGTGLPVFTLRGHDVEEFIGVVKRYGAVTSDIAALVEAAAIAPAISAETLRHGCGTCKA